MSSHHIVRDEQEPALIIISDVSHKLLGELLEWSPTVIIDADLLVNQTDLPFKLDMVIGEEKHIDQLKPKLSHQEPIKYMTKSPEDETAIQAIYYLLAAKYSAINIISKFHETLEGHLLPLLTKIDVVIYEDETKWVFCKNDTYKKWYSKGSSIKLRNSECVPFPQSQMTKISELTFDILSDGMITIKSQRPGFWLGETI